ncbi:hypothetical protein Taro_037986 [Colocasia esculenta]|uniref:Uncharacterized protein n=1 Tax=Colocasia esculenta TaxID=4460 RepID=A0A843WBF0_COLES|nr:hypothetical protein [Colocasia esculenta]
MINALKGSAVLYHYPCPDGAFAALAAHLYFSAVCTPVVFFPNTVYDPIRVKNIGCEHFDDVYLLDFVGPPGFVEELSSKAKREQVLRFPKEVHLHQELIPPGRTLTFGEYSEMLLNKYYHHRRRNTFMISVQKRVRKHRQDKCVSR